MKRRLSVSTALPLAVAILAVAAACVVVVRDRRQLARTVHELGATTAIGSLALGTAGTFVILFLWRAVMRGLDAPTEFVPASRAFFVSQLGKYLPGSVWPVVVQMEFGRRRGIARRTMLAANMITLVLSLTVGLVLAALLLPLSSDAALHRFWWTFLLLPPLIACLHPRAIPALLDCLFRLLRREPLGERLTGHSIAIAVAWATLSWMLLGLHLYVIIHALGAHGAASLAAAVGGTAFAVAAGIAFVPAPAGAGIRDVVLVVVLTPSVGSSAALGAALASRVLLVVADLLLAGGWALVGRGSPVPE